MTGPINFFPVDRYWFLTWTTYGTWLPGDDRGYVGMAPDRDGRLVMHNRLNTPPAPPNPHLRRDAEASLKRTPVVLDIAEAESLLEQFHETANHRRWLLHHGHFVHQDRGILLADDQPVRLASTVAIGPTAASLGMWRRFRQRTAYHTLKQRLAFSFPAGRLSSARVADFASRSRDSTIARSP